MRTGYQTNGVKDLLGKLPEILTTCEKYGFDRVDNNLMALYLYNEKNEAIIVYTQLSGFVSIHHKKGNDVKFLTTDVTKLDFVLSSL